MCRVSFVGGGEEGRVGGEGGRRGGGEDEGRRGGRRGGWEGRKGGGEERREQRKESPFPEMEQTIPDHALTCTLYTRVIS